MRLSIQPCSDCTKHYRGGYIPREKANVFKNDFAVDALPTSFIRCVLWEDGQAAECSSLLELLQAEGVGITGDEIMITSTINRQKNLYREKMSAPISLDDITTIYFLERIARIPVRDTVTEHDYREPRRSETLALTRDQILKAPTRSQEICAAFRPARRDPVRSAQGRDPC